jgi:branched-chain amino acid transport system ATP-binding protein
VLEGRQPFKYLTVEKTLRWAQPHAGQNLTKRPGNGISLFPGPHEEKENPAGYCSGGEIQMVVMGRALMAHPTLLFWTNHPWAWLL